MNPIMIYHMLLLIITIFIMQMNRFFIFTSFLKINITTTSFILTITLSMLKPNIILWCKNYLLNASIQFHCTQILYSYTFDKDIISYRFHAWSVYNQPGTWISLVRWEMPLPLYCQNLCAYTSKSVTHKYFFIRHLFHVLTFFFFCWCVSFSKEWIYI